MPGLCKDHAVAVLAANATSKCQDSGQRLSPPHRHRHRHRHQHRHSALGAAPISPGRNSPPGSREGVPGSGGRGRGLGTDGIATGDGTSDGRRLGACDEPLHRSRTGSPDLLCLAKKPLPPPPLPAAVASRFMNPQSPERDN